MKEELKKSLGVTAAVLFILVVTYFTTAYFLTGEIGDKVKKETQQTEETNESKFDNMIVAGNTFKQSSTDYFVVFYSNDTSKNVEDTISRYKSSDIKLYVVNMDEAVNSYVKSDEQNSFPTKSSELKVKGTTLMRITNGSVTLYSNNNAEIIRALSN